MPWASAALLLLPIWSPTWRPEGGAWLNANKGDSDVVFADDEFMMALRLRLRLPVGTTFVSASDGGLLNAGAGEWELGTLQPGESGTRSVTLESSAGLVDGTLIQAHASLSDTSAPPQLAEQLGRPAW